MKRLILTMLLVCCGLASAQLRPASEEEMAKAFLDAFRSRDTNRLVSLMPTAHVFRITSGEEGVGKTDSTLMADAQSMFDGAKSDFALLLTEADKYKVDISKLRLKAHAMESIPYTPKGFYVQQIDFRYKKKKGSFRIGVAVVEESYYFYAFETTSEVFTKF